MPSSNDARLGCGGCCRQHSLPGKAEKLWAEDAHWLLLNQQKEV